MRFLTGVFAWVAVSLVASAAGAGDVSAFLWGVGAAVAVWGFVIDAVWDLCWFFWLRALGWKW